MINVCKVCSERVAVQHCIALLGEILDENLPVALGKYFIFDQMIRHYYHYYLNISELGNYFYS